MSSSLIQVLVAIATPATPINTPTGAAFASTSVIVTDPVTGAQPAVLLTGIETPTPWAFTTSVNPGNGSVTATALDVNGVALGTPVTQTFTEAGTAPTFFPPTGISVTPVTAASAAAAALRKR
jgi:hypothetical protein